MAGIGMGITLVGGSICGNAIGWGAIGEASDGIKGVLLTVMGGVEAI